MPIDTRQALQSMADSVLRKPIGRLMTNPLALAVLITVIILLIVVYTYDPAHIFLTGFRIFSVALFIMFINNHILLADKHSAELSGDQNKMLAAVSRSSTPGATNGGLVTADIAPPEPDPDAIVNMMATPR